MKLLVLYISLIIPTLIFAQNVKKEIRQGNSEYRENNFSEAETHYRKALEKDPASEKANYNLANSLYKQEEYEPAITKYEVLATSDAEKITKARYYYNLGNSYFKSQKIGESIEAYKNSLRLFPDDEDAKHNLHLAQMMMSQQQQQQQQDKKDQQDKSEENKQNQDQQSDQQQQQEKKEQQGQQQEQQISQQDAERLLEAIEQDEKETMRKVQEQKVQMRKIPVEKEW